MIIVMEGDFEDLEIRSVLHSFPQLGQVLLMLGGGEQVLTSRLASILGFLGHLEYSPEYQKEREKH